MSNTAKKAVIISVLFAIAICNANAMGIFEVGFTGSKNSLRVFKQRLTEIENDGTMDDSFFKSYASSTHRLQQFKRRMQEFENDRTIDEEYLTVYAGSTYSLSQFKRRIQEFVNDGGLDEYYL